MSEDWKQITYAPNYEVSNMARIRNTKRNNVIFINYERLKKTNARARTSFVNNGVRLNHYLHRVVAEHFIENPNKLPEVNHKDGNYYNNIASNLEWISKQDNMIHARENQLVTTYKCGIKVRNKLTHEEENFDSVTQCAEHFNTTPGHICNIINNNHKGNINSKTRRRVIQYNENNEIVNTFNSISEAQKTLNLNNISMCCNYYEHDDLTRPNSYNIKKIAGFIFKFCKETNSVNGNQNKRFIDFEISYLTDKKPEIENKDIIWKEYPFLEKYVVSNTGEVKHKRTGRILMGSKVNGYRFVNLNNNNNIKMNKLIHRLVAETFLENPENKPVVNHKDTNILNNNVNNLEWVTYKENMNTSETKHNLKKGKNSKQILQIRIDTGEILNEFYGASEGEEKLNIPQGYILKICQYYNGNKTSQTFKTYQKTYIFIFEEDKNDIDKYLKIARTQLGGTNIDKCITVNQYEKSTNKLIKTFNSGCEASRLLGILVTGISQCCQYYKYTDIDRPKCYQLKSYKGFIFKQCV